MLRVILASLIFASALAAQDNHYWTHQFGTRASLMGGAVVGGVNDTSAVYYNPARLGWIDNDSLKVSADGYQLAILTIQDGAGKGEDLTSTQGDIVPLAASGVYTFPQPRLALGFHILARQYSDISVSTRREAFQNVIDDTRSPGDEDFIGSFSFNSDVEEYWAGLGFGWAPLDWLSIGITHFGALRFDTQDLSITTRAVNTAGETFGADNIAGWDYWNVRMLWKGGLALEFGGLKMGFTVTTQSLNLFGGATVRRQISVDDLDIDGDGAGNDFEANDRRDGVSTRFRSPWSFATGVDYDFGPVLLAIAAEWFLPVGRYAAAKPTGDKAFYRGGISTENSKDLLTVYDGRRGAFNIAIGLETEFSGDWSGFWSMRRDAGADYLGHGDDLHFGISTWDLFHFATGISFTTRQDDGTPKHELMIGLQLAVGADRTVQPVSFDDPRENRLLTGQTRGTDISYFAISLIVGYTYYF
ncbi:MAG: hypothetical protein K8I27_12975 [Planctomycetes bacterium]|nr:hypothetical protein [Planctomycetota bacterium]